MATFPPSLDLSSLDGGNGFTIRGRFREDFSGYSVNAAGDVNGDGIDDLLVGAWSANPGGRYLAGESYVVFGRAGGFAAALELSALNGSSGFRILGRNAYDRSGWSVSTAGDVNGDGIDDLLIGAQFASPGDRSEAGESYVVFGRAGGFPPALNLSALRGGNGFAIPGRNEGDFSGRSVSAAGDVNGDGIDDLLIGTPGADPGGRSGAGESYVVFGRAAGFASVLEVATLNGTNGFTIRGRNPYDGSGGSVSTAGDVNGDGIDDLLLGAGYNAGESYIVFGRVGGFAAALELATLNGANGFTIRGRSPGDYGGWLVSGAGDVNGDGIDDLLVGAPGADPGGRYNAGESYVVFGRAGGFAPALELAALNGSNGFTIRGRNPGDNSGQSVSAAGDVNGDGIDDLLVGGPFADPGGRSYAGESYVIFGRADGFAPALELAALNGSNGFTIPGHNEGDYSGRSVSAAGDVNGDGIGDLLVGASDADPGGRRTAGESYVIFGRSSALITGSAEDDRLRGDVARNRVEGGDGADRLEGFGAADTLLGEAGNDQLLGGAGDDLLDGGLGRDLLLGGPGADIFVLSETDTYDLIRDFMLGQGDAVRITIDEVLDSTGAVDPELVRARTVSANLLLEIDADFNAATGFQAQPLATLYGAGGLGLADILENAIA